MKNEKKKQLASYQHILWQTIQFVYQLSTYQINIWLSLSLCVALFVSKIVNFIYHSNKTTNIPITRKLKWFCGTVLCWLAIRRSRDKGHNAKREREKKCRKLMYWNGEKSICKWCRINPAESSITNGNWHSNCRYIGGKGSGAGFWHINSHLQSKCSGITTEITHEIPLVDLHIAHIFHWISATGQGYGMYVDSSWLVVLVFVVSLMHMYNRMQHNISIFTHLTSYVIQHASNN